jgi:hypothetical protein
MKIAWLSITAALVAVQPLWAQDNFDMSPEQPSPSVQQEPEAPAAQQPAAPDTALSPTAVGPPTAKERYLLPAGNFALTGEDDARVWTIYLTPEEAASPAGLRLGYQNSVIVAPEASNMRFLVNGRELFDMPIASSDAVAEISVPVPAGLLRAGRNELRLEAIQRHRTDCTIQSTYELWTQVDPARTFLTFSADAASRWTRVDDIRAVGLDPAANTVFNLVVPGIDRSGSAATVIKLAEALALMADMPNQSFSVSDRIAPAPASGQATVVIGTAAELSGLIQTLPEGAATSAISAFMDDATFGPNTLVVTGPTWPAIEAAVSAMALPFDRPLGTQRTTISTGSSRSPDAPMLLGATRRPFSSLGVQTREFSGRRSRTDFAIGIPGDFFANSYGEARILLDAAFSPDVLPGSRVDIYVNGNIAATVPVNEGGGQIMRHSPIKLTMRHFRPGQNTIAIEAILLTAADAVCMPGATALPGSRFALFDTSEFVMPDYARIAQRPNLAAFGGTGYPYGISPAPVSLVFDGRVNVNVSAAATLLARMSVAAGRLVAVDTAVSPASAPGNAVFIGTIAQMPAAILTQVGVADTAASTWGEPAGTAGGPAPETTVTFDSWQNRVGGEGWRGQLQALAAWLTRTFSVSPDRLRFLPGKDTDFTPGNNVSLMVAQQENPGHDGTWTLFTAPTPEALLEGIRALTAQAGWPELSGHITTYDASTAKFADVPVGRFSLVPTQPASIANYRLIVANYLSSNTLSYAMLLAVLCTVLGLATYGLLGRLGRRQ